LYYSLIFTGSIQLFIKEWKINKQRKGLWMGERREEREKKGSKKEGKQ
jgi:hypothetical protein